MGLSQKERDNFTLQASLDDLLRDSNNLEATINKLLVKYKRELITVKEDLIEANRSVVSLRDELSATSRKAAQYEKAIKKALSLGNKRDAQSLHHTAQVVLAARENLQRNYDAALQNYEKVKVNYDRLVEDLNELERRKKLAKTNLSLTNVQRGVNDIRRDAYINDPNSKLEKHERDIALAQDTELTYAKSEEEIDLVSKYTDDDEEDTSLPKEELESILDLISG